MDVANASKVGAGDTAIDWLEEVTTSAPSAAKVAALSLPSVPDRT